MGAGCIVWSWLYEPRVSYSGQPHGPHGLWPAERFWPAAAAASAPSCPSPGPRSSPRSPMSTPAISRPTSRAARNSATCCSGLWSSRTWSRCCSRRCRPSSASSPGRSLAQLCRERIPPPARLGDVGRERGGGDGDRPRRISGRRPRPQFAVRLAADRRACSSPASRTYAVLLLQRRGFRPIELVIGGFVASSRLAISSSSRSHRRTGPLSRSMPSCRSSPGRRASRSPSALSARP